VDYYPGIFSTSKDFTERWCEAVLAATELTGVEKAFPAQLSGGELQRARLACAMAPKPGLCCADEPLTEVGLLQKWRVLNRWSTEMSERHTALLLVSHDVDILMYLCDEIILLGGPSDEPARIISRFVMHDEPHPRNLTSLSTRPFEEKRRAIIEILYLGS
jgi:ABC-type nitrate/sulfonate/bicarbonate transport system ATPase subunit